MTTTETTTCDGCGRAIEAEPYREIKIQGPYTYEDDPDDKHLCEPCWGIGLSGAKNQGAVAPASNATWRDTCQCGPCRDVRRKTNGDTP